MTRQEFLAAGLRSWPVRMVGLLLAGVIAAYVAAGLWQARSFLAFAAIVAGLIVLAHLLSYLFSGAQRRIKLDEESRRTRSHWSYAERGLLWPGLGVAFGSLVAYWSSGRDPSGGLIAGGVLASVGAVAHLVWAQRRRAR